MAFDIIKLEIRDMTKIPSSLNAKKAAQDDYFYYAY